jgi:hypothetical protein
MRFVPSFTISALTGPGGLAASAALARSTVFPSVSCRRSSAPLSRNSSAPIATTTPDEETFVEEFARELWESSDDRSWDEAGDYWRDAYRKQGRLAADILRRRGLLA